MDVHARVCAGDFWDAKHGVGAVVEARDDHDHLGDDADLEGGDLVAGVHAPSTDSGI